MESGSWIQTGGKGVVIAQFKINSFNYLHIQHLFNLFLDIYSNSPA